MRRRKVYLMVGVGIISVIVGNRIYQKSLVEGSGYLGDEVVFFAEVASPDAESEDESGDGGDTGDDVWDNAEDSADGDEADTTEKGQEMKTGGEAAAPLDEEGLPISSIGFSGKPYEKIVGKGKIELYNSTGTVKVDNTAYELYNYVNSYASRYARAVNNLTKKLDSSIKVYDLVAPTSVGITFPDNRKKKLNSSDQEEALNNIERKLSGREEFVPLYDILMQHRTEYIFFRTDHHWTSLGAYYAYCAFCAAKGIVPNELSAYDKKSSEGFLGTFYRDTDQNKELKADTLETLLPISQNLSFEYTTVEGNKLPAPVIADADSYSASLKYCAYIAGDNPYSVIRNKDITDGSSCIVVKESYGNAFVPFLADHYQTIYIVDYRYWEGDLYDFIKKKKLREVILINNISMTRNSYLIGKLTQIIG